MLWREYGLLAQWVLGATVEFGYGRRVHAALALVNAAFLAYAIATFVGMPRVVRHWLTFRARPSRPEVCQKGDVVGSATLS